MKADDRVRETCATRRNDSGVSLRGLRGGHEPGASGRVRAVANCDVVALRHGLASNVGYEGAVNESASRN